MVALGEGLFETMRVVDSRPHALTRHLDRLRAAASTLGLDAPDDGELRRRIAAHLRSDPLPLGRLRLTLVAGPGGSRTVIETAPTPSPRPVISLTFSSWQVPQEGPLVGLKSTSYVDYRAVLRSAQAQGFDDALLTNAAGALCETTTANVFLVLDGVLCTPPLSAGCLPGIARGLVTELCDVFERDLAVDALDAASEVFVTSSLRAVQPVTRIDERSYPELGPITALAQREWRRLADLTWDPPLPDRGEYENGESVR